MPIPSDGLVLHLIWSEWDGDAPYLVSPATVEAAQCATDDDAPHPPMNFGDVRRSGDLVQLEELLADYFGASLEQYVAGIEAAVGRPIGGGDIAGRLAALNGFDFAGDTTAMDECDSLPADDFDFREEQVAWDAPEVRYRDVLAQATANDLPPELVEEYCSNHYATGSPGSSGAHVGTWADPLRLDELIVILEARGYTVIRDGAEAHD